MSANVIGHPRAKRPNDIPRNYPCVECGKDKSARRKMTRCSDCSHALVLERRKRQRQDAKARNEKREREHQTWLNVRARLADSKHEATVNAFRTAHGEVTPYDEMTATVERETGTSSSTWNVIDPRWDRVTYLTRVARHPA